MNPATSPVRDGQVGLYRLGQSGFVIRFRKARVLIDGFFSEHRERLFPPPFRATEASGFDVIACTHDHLDHLDRDAMPDLALASPHARFVVPSPLVGVLVAIGITPDRIIGMRPGAPAQVGDVEMHAVPARHAGETADPYGFGEDETGAPSFLGFVLRGGGVAVYHAGDTIDYDGLAGRVRQLHVDVALLPINGRDAERENKGMVGNLNAREAAKVGVESGADVVVPMHYDMFAGNPGDPGQFVREVGALGRQTTALVMPVGREFVYTKPA